MVFKREELEDMKRAELQKLCKSYGVKANMKTTQLIDALLQIFLAQDQDDQIVYTNAINAVIAVTETDLPAEEAATKSARNIEVAEKKMEFQNDNEEQTISDKVESKVAQPSKKRKRPQRLKASSKIPRLTNVVKSTKKVVLCSTSTPQNNESKTPKRNTGSKDWSKIHQKQFDKMDSLGDYLDKKRKRAVALSSVKKVKDTTPKQQQVKPVVDKKRLTFNFRKSAKENVLVTPRQVKRRATLGAIKTPTQTTQHKTAVTPFRFSAAGNTSVGPGLFSPTPRKVFDLKASLAKPLAYKPHRGKLPTTKYATKENTKITTPTKKNATHERNVKTVKVTSRQERREKQKKDVSKKRSDAICRRRGVIC